MNIRMQMLMCACLVVTGACGTSKQTAARAPESAGALAPQRSLPSQPQRDEIEALWRGIDDLRAPSGTIRASSAPEGERVVEVSCELGTMTEVASEHACSDACVISRSICRSSEEICRLAGELEGDRWAVEKCRDARQACTAAEKQCCECLASRP